MSLFLQFVVQREVFCTRFCPRVGIFKEDLLPHSIMELAYFFPLSKESGGIRQLAHFISLLLSPSLQYERGM
jgi:hypothetical protein